MNWSIDSPHLISTFSEWQSIYAIGRITCTIYIIQGCAFARVREFTQHVFFSFFLASHVIDFLSDWFNCVCCTVISDNWNTWSTDGSFLFFSLSYFFFARTWVCMCVFVCIWAYADVLWPSFCICYLCSLARTKCNCCCCRFHYFVWFWVVAVVARTLSKINYDVDSIRIVAFLKRFALTSKNLLWLLFVSVALFSLLSHFYRFSFIFYYYRLNCRVI